MDNCIRTVLKPRRLFLLLHALFLVSNMAIISTNSSIFYIRDSIHKSSYYHIAYAATNATANGTKSFKVTIPKGSANPQVDISKLGPRQWYLPREVTARVNDTVTWTNNDTEAHTVTSGIGAGIESLMNNKKGTPNGFFDSGWFRPGQSWTLALELDCDD